MRYILTIIILCLPVIGQQRATYDIGVKYRIDAGTAAITRPSRTGAGSPAGRDACSFPGETYFQTDAAAGQNIWGCTREGSSDVAVWKLMGNGYPVRMGSGEPQGAQACSAVGELYFQTNATPGQNLYGCTATGTSSTATWTRQSGSGGAGASDPINTGAGHGIWWPWGPVQYGPAGAALSGSAANRGSRYQFTLPAMMEFRYLAFYVNTASGTGCTGGTCGLQFAIYSYDFTSKLAYTTVATSGSGGCTDINTTGAKRVTLAGGTAVSGGTAVLPPGVYWIVASTDSTALFLGTYGESRFALVANAGGESRYAAGGAALSTGNGASLSLPENLSAVSVWTAHTSSNIPQLALIN